jgi:hypothetical protein
LPDGQLVDPLFVERGTVWLAQALEEDVAGQASSPLRAIAELGRILDVRVAADAQEGGVVRPPHAPPYYEHLWDAGTSIGEHVLGRHFIANVRTWFG